MTSSNQSQLLHEIQRIQVGVEGQSAAKRLKISLENYDEGLGWYSAASISIPMHQLPLLQQAVQSLSHEPGADAPESRKVIPFPGLRAVSSS